MSRQLLLGLLGALALLLILTIGYEIFAPNADEAGIAAPAADHAATPAATPANRGVAGAQTATWVGTILARPLFAVSRKPDAGPATAAAAASDDATDLPRLAGVLFYGTTKRALFQPVGDVPELVVGEGELVSGWTVARIEHSSVTLTGPKGETTVEPKFDENLVPPPPQLPPVLAKPAALAAARGNVPPAVAPPRPNAAPPGAQFQRPVPGQPTAVPTRPPFIPQQRSAPQNGAPVPPGAR